MSAGRRNFRRWTLGGVAGLAASNASDARASTPTELMGDEAWLAAVSAKKYKANLDVMHFFPDGTPFRRAGTLLRVMHESYGAAESEMGAAVGMLGRGLVHLMTAAAWDELVLDDWLMPQLNAAETAAMKGGSGAIAAEGGTSSGELRARGVRFLACRETIGRWAVRVAALKSEWVKASREKILKGLVEGVEAVPAMTAASVVAQESGARYLTLA